MSVLGLLNSTCTIRRKTNAVSSTTGANSPTWASNATGVRCAVQPSRSYEARQNFRDTGTSTFNVYFESDADVREDDRINTIVVDGSSTSWSGRELTVTSPPIDHAGRRTYTMVTAEERKGGGLP